MIASHGNARQRLLYTLFVLKYKCWITYVDNQIVFSSVTTSY